MLVRWVSSAKKDETKDRRLSKLREESAKGEAIVFVHEHNGPRLQILPLPPSRLRGSICRFRQPQNAADPVNSLPTIN